MARQILEKSRPEVSVRDYDRDALVEMFRQRLCNIAMLRKPFSSARRQAARPHFGLTVIWWWLPGRKPRLSKGRCFLMTFLISGSRLIYWYILRESLTRFSRTPRRSGKVSGKAVSGFSDFLQRCPVKILHTGKMQHHRLINPPQSPFFKGGGTAITYKSGGAVYYSPLEKGGRGGILTVCLILQFSYRTTLI